MSYNFKFTVFTPTYNRVKVINRVYSSLLNQTFHNFEWLIIDDGSTDKTAELVQSWKNDPNTWFPIRYYWQENQHKKVAHNNAVKLAKGELFLTFDSDDRCTPNALQRFYYHWQSIPEEIKSEFSAITCLCVDENGNLVGDLFPCENWIDSNTLDIAYRYRIRGEKWSCHSTQVLSNFLFPTEAISIPGLIAEGLIWNKIAEQFKSRFINESLRVYYSDGFNEGVIQVSAKSQIKQNCIGGLYGYSVFLNKYLNYVKYDPLTFIKVGALMTRFYLHCDRPINFQFWPDQLFGKFWVIILSPLGLSLYIKDRLFEFLYGP